MISGSGPERSPLPAEGRWLRRIGAVGWPSFLTAAAANGAFFSMVDPVELGRISFPDWVISREMGYTVGFFMFWAVCAVAATLTAYLLETPPPRTAPSRQDEDE